MKVGFIGLGNMGSPMAYNIAAQGHELKVYDVSQDAVKALLAKSSASAAESPAEAARGAEVIFMSLPTPAIVKEVVIGKGGILEKISAGSIIADLSTVTPNTIKSLLEPVEKAGGVLIDAPVSGGVAGAQKRQLTVMVGGDKNAFERCRPLLEAIGNNIFYVGSAGNANAVKILNQYLFAANLGALCEALTVAKELKLDLGMLFDILEKSSGSSYAVKTRREKLLNRTFEPGFMLQLMLKDLGLFEECAREEMMPLFIGNAVRNMYTVANRKGFGRSDLARVLEGIEGITSH